MQPRPSLVADLRRDRAGNVPMLVWTAVAWAVLTGWTLLQERPIFWDEVWHLQQAQALAGADSILSWLESNQVSACGPFYPAVHWLLSGGNGILPVPWVRLPNLVALAFIVVAAGRTMVARGQPAAAAGALLAIPMIWVTAGLALTEIPAIAGATLAGWAAVERGRPAAEPAAIRRWTLLFVLGLSCATLTRQTLAVVAPGLAIIAFRGRRDFAALFCALVLGLAPLGLLAVAWGGLLPPKLEFVSGFEASHALLAFCITGLVVVLVAPTFFVAHWRSAATVGVTVATLNVLLGWVHPAVLTSVQKMVGDPAWALIVERSLAWFAVLLGAGFTASAVETVWRNRDRSEMGLLLVVLAINLACAANRYQFSSRYPAIAAPFLIMFLAPWVQLTPWALARYTFGAGVGFMALRSYYVFAP